MTQVKNVYKKQHKLVATWIPVQDFALLQHLAFKNKVNLATYIRAILVDALYEERELVDYTNLTIETSERFIEQV
jgi:hypothetical protein